MNAARTIAAATVGLMLVAGSVVGHTLWEELRVDDAGFGSGMLMFGWAMSPYMGMALLAMWIGPDDPRSGAVLLAGSLAIGMLGLLAFPRGFMGQDLLRGLAVLSSPIWQWGGCAITGAIAAHARRSP